MSETNASRGQVWLLWVVASGLGGALVAVVARAAAYGVGYAMADFAGSAVLSEVALGIVALGGFMGAIGFGQWLVMMKLVPWSGRWLLASTLGGAAGGGVMLGLFAALPGETLSPIVGVLMGLAALGATQWIVLRGSVAFAGRLALASVGGLVAAAIGAGLVSTIVAAEIAAGAAFGASSGAVTGAVFARRAMRQDGSWGVAKPSTG